MVFQYKKPKYRVYSHLLEDIRNDFKVEKFNNLKWKKLKNILRFQANKWSSFYYNERIQLFKKLKFVYNHFELSGGSEKRTLKLNSIFLNEQKQRKFYDNSVFSILFSQRLTKEFKNNLLNKQKFLFYYNIRNHKLKKIVKKEINKKNIYFKKKYIFINDLEKRLDNVLYKSGFVKNIFQSRQFINYGKILVNKSKQSKIDYLVKAGDLIEFINLPILYLKKNLVTTLIIKKKNLFFKNKFFILNSLLKKKFYKIKKEIKFFNRKYFLFNNINKKKFILKKLIEEKVLQEEIKKKIEFFDKKNIYKYKIFLLKEKKLFFELNSINFFQLNCKKLITNLNFKKKKFKFKLLNKFTLKEIINLFDLKIYQLKTPSTNKYIFSLKDIINLLIFKKKSLKFIISILNIQFILIQLLKIKKFQFSNFAINKYFEDKNKIKFIKKLKKLEISKEELKLIKIKILKRLIKKQKKSYKNDLKKIINIILTKREKLKFLFLYFFSNFLEINYKTFSILILKDPDPRKSFKFFLNLYSIYNYYFHN